MEGMMDKTVLITVSMTTDVSGRNGVGGGSGRGKMMKDEIDIAIGFL